MTPSLLFDVHMLTLCHHLRAAGGLAINNFVNAVNEQRRYPWLHGFDCHLRPDTDDRMVGEAMRNYSPIVRHISNPTRFAGTPISTAFTPSARGMCPVCCDDDLKESDCKHPTPVAWDEYDLLLEAAMSSQRAEMREVATAAAGLSHVDSQAPFPFPGSSPSTPPTSSPSGSLPPLLSTLPLPTTDLRHVTSPACAVPPPCPAPTTSHLPPFHIPLSTSLPPALPSVPHLPAQLLTPPTGPIPAAGPYSSIPHLPAPLLSPSIASSSASAHFSSVPHLPQRSPNHRCSASQQLLVSAGSTAPASSLPAAQLLPPSAPSASSAPAAAGGFQFFQSGTLTFRTRHRLERRPRYITADGAQKLMRFANCGTTATAVERELNYPAPFAEYFSARVATVYEYREQKASVRPLLAPVDTECQADLLAARSMPPTSKSANTDVKLVVGCVCPHTVGLRTSYLFDHAPGYCWNFQVQHNRLAARSLVQVRCPDGSCIELQWHSHNGSKQAAFQC